MNDRTEVLKTLLGLNQPIEETVGALSNFEWDSDELVVLETAHIKHVLERYLSGDLNEDIVESWANAIECRDDIGLSKKNEEFIEEIIYELANPDLTQGLTPERAQVLVRSLET